VTAPPPLRSRLAGRQRGRLVAEAARLRVRSSDDLEQRTLVEILRRLGARAQFLGKELHEVERRIAELVKATGLSDSLCRRGLS
jgi:hypothetical protein